MRHWRRGRDWEAWRGQIETERARYLAESEAAQKGNRAWLGSTLTGWRHNAVRSRCASDGICLRNVTSDCRGSRSMLMSATRHRESSRLKQLREGLGSGWLLWQSEARASASIEVMIAVVVVDMVDSRLGFVVVVRTSGGG